MKKITDKSINKFKEYLTNEEKSKATIEKYIRDLTTFAAWLGKTELSKAKMLEYKEYLIEVYAPASVNSVISSLNSFFDYIGQYALKVKTLKIQRQIFARKDKELTKAEYERLLSAAKSKGNRKLYLLMQTICACGIRVSELRYISIESLQKGQAVINMKGKMRTIIIPRNLCKILKSMPWSKKYQAAAFLLQKQVGHLIEPTYGNL